MNPSTFRISTPTAPRDPAADVAVIRDVFGLEPTSAVLAEITQASQKTLHRAARGTAIRPREHVQIVADLAIEIRDMMFADPTWTDDRRRAMREWLDSGEIEFDGQIYSPRDVLADDALARRALTELRAQLG